MTGDPDGRAVKMLRDSIRDTESEGEQAMRDFVAGLNQFEARAREAEIIERAARKQRRER